MFQSVTESLAIGNLSSPEELQEISQQGYSTVIDLCTPTEGIQLNAEEVQKLGLNYISIPVSPQNLNSEVLQTFSETVHTASQPVYIRCASGLRAGVFTLLTLADQQNWTEQEYLERHQKLGLEHKPSCLLKAFSEENFAGRKS
jgi:uncharacterized protein (TIGR01244 family)